MFEDLDWEERSGEELEDPVEIDARKLLRDFFERNPQGVYFSRQLEVQNEARLGYMDRIEFETKIRLCRQLGVRPVFAARMLPKSWINDLNNAGGFALIIKYQLYPWAHRELARKVRVELGLPVDSPRRLGEGTMARFLRWHERL